MVGSLPFTWDSRTEFPTPGVCPGQAIAGLGGEAAERAPPSQLLKYYCFLKAKDSVPRQGQLRSFMVSPCPVVIQVTGEHGVGRKGRGALAGWESVGSWDLPTPAPRGVWGQWKGTCVLTVFGLPSWRAWKLESGAPPPAVSSPSRLGKPETGGGQGGLRGSNNPSSRLSALPTGVVGEGAQRLPAPHVPLQVSGPLTPRAVGRCPSVSVGLGQSWPASLTFSHRGHCDIYVSSGRLRRN